MANLSVRRFATRVALLTGLTQTPGFTRAARAAGEVIRIAERGAGKAVSIPMPGR